MSRRFIGFLSLLFGCSLYAAAPAGFNFTECIKTNTKECVIAACGFPAQPNCRAQCHQTAILTCRKILKQHLS
jgi:hypothetical protein